MRIIVPSVAAALLSSLLPWAGLAAQPRPSDRILSPQASDRVREVIADLPRPPEPVRLEEERIDAADPQGSEAGAPLDATIDADRLPGVEPPPDPTLNGMTMMAMRRYANLMVLGTGVSQFYYIRQDIFFEFSDGDEAGFRRMMAGGNYGPHPIGASVPMVRGSNYLLFPACRGGIAWETYRLARLPASGPNGQVTLSCQPRP